MLTVLSTSKLDFLPGHDDRSGHVIVGLYEGTCCERALRKHGL